MFRFEGMGRWFPARRGALRAAALLAALAAATGDRQPARADQPNPVLASIGNFGSGPAAGRKLIRLAERAYNRGKEGAAIALATRAIETGDLTPADLRRGLNFRARVYRRSGFHDRAIDDYSTLIRRDPLDADALLDRGWTFYGKGDHDRAIADYGAALRLRPDALAYNNRCLAYMDKRRYVEAIEDCGRAIELGRNPSLKWAYRNRGLAHSRSGDQDRAIEDYSAAIRLDPGYTDAYIGRGWSYARKALNARAIEDYTTALRLAPRHALAYNNRCMVYRKEGQYDRAITDCTRSIELGLGTDLHWSYSNRGWAYLGKRLYRRAIDDYSTAIELKPDYAHAFYGRGRAYWGAGEWRRAAEDYRRAAELDPDNEVYLAARVRHGALAVGIAALTGLIGAYAVGTVTHRRGWRSMRRSLAVLAGFVLGVGAGLVSATLSLFV